MVLEVLLLLVLLTFSAFFAGTETAFVVVNRLKMEIKARKKHSSARLIMYFAGKPEKFFSTILIGSNIVNIGFASICTVILTGYGFDEWHVLIVSTVILLVFGELIPKYISREHPDQITLIGIVPVKWLSVILAPVIKITAWLAIIITGQRKLDEHAYQNYFDREDISELVQESEAAGEVSHKESIVINNVLRLRHQRVEEAMRPRTEVVGIDIESSLEEVLDLFVESGYSKLPVYEENLDHITGIVVAYDLFKSPASLKEIMREVIFVPEARKCIDMLNDFINQKASFAVVVDEFGGTAGIITMEDLIEELYGEIKDEYDSEEDVCRKTGDNTYIINGKVEIDFLNEQFDLEIEKGDYETIAGLITAHIGRIPKNQEEIRIGHLNFHIIRASNVRIELVKLIVTDQSVQS